MNAKENYLEAIQFGNPEYVPLGCEPCWHTFELAGNFRSENWRDSWGITWEVGIEGTVPFPKGNPLPNLDRLADYPFPHPGDLVFTEQMKEQFAAVDRAEQFVFGRLIYLLFERAWAPMGMDSFLVALLTDPAEAPGARSGRVSTGHARCRETHLGREVSLGGRSCSRPPKRRSDQVSCVAVDFLPQQETRMERLS